MTVSVTVGIDRTSLGKTPLVLSAAQDGAVLGINAYQPPGRVARNTYLSDNPNIDGAQVIASAWQQAVLGFSVVSDGATSEADIATAIAELVEAVGQFAYLVTTAVGNAPAEVWSADRGSVTPPSDGRTYVDLANLDPVYAVTIPVYPTPGA